MTGRFEVDPLAHFAPVPSRDAADSRAQDQLAAYLRGLYNINRPDGDAHANPMSFRNGFVVTIDDTELVVLVLERAHRFAGVAEFARQPAESAGPGQISDAAATAALKVFWAPGSWKLPALDRWKHAIHAALTASTDTTEGS